MYRHPTKGRKLLPSGIDRETGLPIKEVYSVICGGTIHGRPCGFVFYDGTTKVEYDDVRKQYNGKCPQCGKTMANSPEEKKRVEIKKEAADEGWPAG